MYQFKPMSEDELNSPLLLDEGVYEFQVISSTRKQKNYPMAELYLKISGKNNFEFYLYDYLIFSTAPLNIRKIKHFCDATGFSEHYKKGEMPEELSSLKGILQLGIQNEKEKPGGGFYPKKNYVIDYLNNESIEINKELDNLSDIPF